jgi:DNA segregation ATPase FtsK/SpoIIIE, S-DNA-T family
VGRARTARSKPDAQPANRKLWRRQSLILVAVAPVVLFLLASLLSYSPDDPGWSRSGSVTGQVSNFGGSVGCLAFGPGVLLLRLRRLRIAVRAGGIVVWVALFGMADDRGAGFRPGVAPGRPGRASWCAPAAWCTSRWAVAPALPAGFRRHPRPAGRAFVLQQLLGPFGANLFLLAAVLAAAITLATGLSWLALMDRLGQWTIAFWGRSGPAGRAWSACATEWRQARALPARCAARRARSKPPDAPRREPIRIEPPPAPVIEKSERAKREQQIPLFHTDRGRGTATAVAAR